MKSPPQVPLDAMVAVARDPMTLLDRDLIYREANRAYLEARGLRRDEVVGRTVTDLWGDEVGDSIVGESLRRALGGEPVRYRAFFEVARGRERFMEVTYDPVLAADGGATHVVVTSRDLSAESEMAAGLEAARVEVEEGRQRRAAALGRLASDLAERIDRLLASLDATEVETDSAARRGHLRSARYLATGILSSVDEALHGAGLEGTAGREQVPFHLLTLLDEVGLTAGRLAASRGLLILVHPSPDLPEHVRGDRLRLRETLRELLEHAIERTESGRVELRIGWAAASPEAGGGERTKTREPLLFEARIGAPRRGGAASSERLKEAAERLGATLELAEDGQSFRVRTALSAAAAARTPQRTGGGPQVLVVDDLPVNLEVEREQLVQRRLRVDVAHGGVEALQRLAEGGLDLVFLDWRMPDLDGLAVARAQRQREREQGLDRLPLVVVTASAVAGDREECLAAGMDDYITKPLRAADLDRILARWLPSGLGDGAPALDPQALANLDDPADPGFLAELADLFLADAPPRLDALATAQRCGDSAGARTAAHALRGSAANLGALPLAELCKRTEEAARTGASGVDELVAAVEREYARAAAALSAGRR